jgi:TRAP-type C4-dicarboxylate transport system permease small subunit
MQNSPWNRAKQRLDRILGAVLVVMMAAAVLNVLWQVATRFLLGDPSTVTQELARYLLIWLSILGASYVVGQRGHLALELLLEKLSGRGRRTVQFLILGCVAAFALFVFVVGGARFVYIQAILGQTSPTLGWPLWTVYTVLPISGLLMLVYTGIHALQLQSGDRPLGEPPSSEDTPMAA